MITLDTLRRFGDILKLYSEQFELIYEDSNNDGQLIDGIVFMEDYPLMIKEAIDDLLESSK